MIEFEETKWVQLLFTLIVTDDQCINWFLVNINLWIRINN
jgi:hypothetical protein